MRKKMLRTFREAKNLCEIKSHGIMSTKLKKPNNLHVYFKKAFAL